MNKPMIILVHGGCHTASCWDRLLPELRAFGRDVLAIDLPGHGRDPVSEPTPNLWKTAS